LIDCSFVWLFVRLLLFVVLLSQASNANELHEGVVVAGFASLPVLFVVVHYLCLSTLTNSVFIDCTQNDTETIGISMVFILINWLLHPK
jgi:hypothetical protein